MDKNKVASLAKYFSSSCKQVIKGNQFARELTSPAVMLITLTVLNVIVNEIGIDKHLGWAQT